MTEKFKDLNIHKCFNFFVYIAHRRITNLILNHICDAFALEIPGRILVKRIAKKGKNIVNQEKKVNAKVEEQVKEQASEVENQDEIEIIDLT